MTIDIHFRESISEIKDKIRQKIDQVQKTKILSNVQYKKDNSPVTEVDIYISDLFKEYFSEYLNNGYTFYSEEDFTQLKLPALIIDPIDGTKEFIKSIPQCAVSFSIVEELKINTKNTSWIFNPLNGFEISNDSSAKTISGISKQGQYIGLVSNTEWNQGLYKDVEDHKEIQIKSVGSIAYKLGLLAAGECQFVVTRKPKNIWDILAGTLLCAEKKIYAYNSKGKIKNLHHEKFDGPMLWANEEVYKKISTLFFESEK